MPEHFGVGVNLEVRLHLFAAGVNRGGEAGKNPRLRSARREFKNGNHETQGLWERAQKNFEKECLGKTMIN